MFAQIIVTKEAEWRRKRHVAEVRESFFFPPLSWQEVMRNMSTTSIRPSVCSEIAHCVSCVLCHENIPCVNPLHLSLQAK